MRITTLGARANTPAKSDRYQKRTLICLSSDTTVIWIDCRGTWRGEVHNIQPQPDAIYYACT